MTRVAPQSADLSPGRWLHRFAIAVAACTWLLIMAGGMVTSTGSGLSVPDWPTTYGYNMFTYPFSKWVGGIFYEHSHRLIASTVGFLTIILCVWLWRKEQRRWLCWLGTIALVAVIIQGILGGLTVRYLLPTPISVMHACLAQTFFCIVISIAVFTSPGWRRTAIATQPGMSSTRGLATPHLAVLMTAVVFGQLILGAIMRHTESGLAVPDFPTAYGQWVPDLSPSAIDAYNEHRRFELLMPVVSVSQISYHLAHRWSAVIVAAVTIWLAVRILKQHRSILALRRVAKVTLVLLLIQIGLGAWTVWSGRDALVATGHVAVGAAMLGAAWFMTLQSFRCVPLARRAGYEVLATPQAIA